MKKIFILSVAATLICSFSFATIRRVGYPGPQVTGTDFTDAATAVTASAANDTVQLYPGVSNSLPALAKPLVFLGPGYFLNINPGLQVTTNTATISVSFLAGASGSIFEGLTVSAYNTGFNSTSMPTNTFVQNILFKRCQITAGYLYYNGTANTGIQNFTFSDCFFTAQFWIYLTNSGAFAKNCVWRNCIFLYNGVSATVNLSGAGSISSGHLYENCSFYGSTDGNDISSSTYFRNCIIKTEPTSVNNDVYDYCTFTTNNATHYITGASNQFGKTLANIYNGDVTISYTTNGDAPWKLKAGSPAIGWGRDYTNNPTDGGAYGGADPYRLSGIPRVPSFYQLSSSAGVAATANPYPVTFSVRANN